MAWNFMTSQGDSGVIPNPETEPVGGKLGASWALEHQTDALKPETCMRHEKWKINLLEDTKCENMKKNRAVMWFHRNRRTNNSRKPSQLGGFFSRGRRTYRRLGGVFVVVPTRTSFRFFRACDAKLCGRAVRSCVGVRCEMCVRRMLDSFVWKKVVLFCLTKMCRQFSNDFLWRLHW